METTLNHLQQEKRALSALKKAIPLRRCAVDAYACEDFQEVFSDNELNYWAAIIEKKLLTVNYRIKRILSLSL